MHVETPLQLSESIVIAASPQALYDMVADVTRMGEWSPVTTSCRWDEGAGPAAGAWFTGRNEMADRDPWETRSQVVVADPGREFAFQVGGSWTRWGYTFTPVPQGTEVTESWALLPDGRARFDDRFGGRAPEVVQERYEWARDGIPATLAALKRVAESAG
jgi:hypothetical protein